jgi:hypothetical protein
MKHFFSKLPLIGFLVAIPIIAVLTNLAGCANIIPPTGGPRDSLPPMLLSVNPADSSTGITPKRIVFQFDEFIQLDNNLQQQLIISPTPKSAPTIEGRLRTVTIQIRDTLEPNTTYRFDFGNALRDLNEGNIYQNFEYIFSTGPTLDSLEFSGNVILAQTGGIDSSLIVILHRSLEDSAVINDRPRFVARVNNQGNFNFRSLPGGTYAVYAMKDESGSRRYLSKSQLFAFADSPVVVQPGVAPITMYAYVEAPDTARTQASATGATQRRTDANAQDRRLRFLNNLREGQLSLLENLVLTFNVPLRTFDSTKVVLADETFQPIAGSSMQLDTAKKNLTIFNRWTENTNYNLLLGEDFAEDTTGKKLLRADTLKFKTRQTREYGLVRLRFLNLDLSKSPILLFVQNDEVKYTHIFTDRNFNATLFAPGDYDLRIVYDENKNGKWDPGKFFGEHRQPERVLPVSRKLTIKANWDNEVDIQL